MTGNYQLDTSPDALTDAGHSATVEASGVASLSLHCHRRRKRRRLLTGVSRQRRAANARERVRIQGVNSAFVVLKNTLPVVRPDDVSKIETLRLASKWIAYLTTVLIRDDQRRAVSPVPGRGGVPESVRDRLMELLHFEIEDFDVVETRSLLSPGVAASDECDSRDANYATCNARTATDDADFATNIRCDATKTADVQYTMCNAFANTTCNGDATTSLRTATHQRITRHAKRSTYNEECAMDSRNSVTFNIRYPACDNVAGFTTSDMTRGTDNSAIRSTMATGYVDQTRFHSLTTICHPGKRT